MATGNLSINLSNVVVSKVPGGYFTNATGSFNSNVGLYGTGSSNGNVGAIINAVGVLPGAKVPTFVSITSANATVISTYGYEFQPGANLSVIGARAYVNGNLATEVGGSTAPATLYNDPLNLEFFQKY